MGDIIPQDVPHDNKKSRGRKRRKYTIDGIKMGREAIARMTQPSFDEFRTRAKRNIFRSGYNEANRKQWHNLSRELSVIRRTHQINISDKYKKREDSLLLNAFYPERKKLATWKERAKRKDADNQIVQFSRFSFIDEPEATIEKLVAVAKAECVSKNLRLNFSDRVCLDISPYLILSKIRDDMPAIHSGGAISDYMHKVLEVVGLDKGLGVSPNISILQTSDITTSPSDNPDGSIQGFPNRCRVRYGKNLPANLDYAAQIEDKTAKDFCDKLETWIKRKDPSKVLSEITEDRIKSFITELLGNATRHSALDGSKDGEWCVAGCMQDVKDRDGDEVSLCNLSIVSFGRSFYESLQSAPNDVRALFTPYVERHKGKDYSEELLWTLSAIQDKVSCIDPTKDIGASELKGLGLMTSIMDVLYFLFCAKNPIYNPSVTIISGTSYISVKHPYYDVGGEHGERRLFLNKENSPSLPPDKNNAKSLAVKFPGTIISIRFVIRSEEKA